MNSYPKILIICIVETLLMAAISCQASPPVKPDAVTGATLNYHPKEISLPPQAGEYKVLGQLKGLKNFVVKYDEHLYRGGEPYSTAAAPELQQIGIKTIISITPTDFEREFCGKYEFKLVEIPFEKTSGPSPADLNLYLQTVKTGTGPFYVHCHGGTHRGGVLGVAYRTLILNWPYEKALVEYGRLGGDLLDDHAMLEAVQSAE
jgi:protein tyrosine/serine phosphatase